MDRRIRRSLFAGLASVAAVALLFASTVGAAPAARTTQATLQRLLNRLVAADGGPVGAILTVYRNGRTTVLRAGRADASRPGAPRPGEHMRIASVTKAFTGAVALHLVQQGKLALNDTIGRRLPGMPRGLVESDDPADARPHQRAARLHAVRRLSKAGDR